LTGDENVFGRILSWQDRGEGSRPDLSGSFLDEFSEDAAPMPLTFVIAKGADNVEQDATETKLSELGLHKSLIWFSRFLKVFVTAFTERTRMGFRNLQRKTGGPMRGNIRSIWPWG
jgi:hypothetical protein